MLDVLSTTATSLIKGSTTASGGVGVEGVGETGVVGTSNGGAGIGVSGTGSVYGVFANGDLGASGTKSFVQPHPLDASKEIRFVCLEGNESGTYFRGSGELVGGRAVLVVPESFRLTTEAEHLTVQLTPMGDARMWVEAKGLDRIVVRGSADVSFDYFVNGVRRGYADFVPIQDNVVFRPRRAGEPFGEHLAPAVRAMLVENGTLNPDFTPNEATARLLGWLLERAAPVGPNGLEEREADD